MPKRPKRLVHSYGYSYSPTYTPNNEWFRSRGVVAVMPSNYNPDEFTASDHMYWWGDKQYKTLAKCRICLTLSITRMSREAHLRETDCRDWLFKMIKRLRQDAKCVICNAAVDRMYGSRWGMFLCSEACVEKFKYDLTGHGAIFKEALRLEGFDQDEDEVKNLVC